MLEKLKILQKELREIIAKVNDDQATFADVADKSDEFRQLISQMVNDTRSQLQQGAFHKSADLSQIQARKTNRQNP